MIELVFSDSAKVLLTQAFPDAVVLGLSLYADMGSISGGLFAGGASNRLRALFAHYPEGDEAADEMMRADRADRDKLLTRAKAGDIIRIWYGSCPSEYCGMLHTMSLLEGIPCSVLLVKLPEVIETKDGFMMPENISEVPEPLVRKLSESVCGLSDWERSAYVRLWRELQRENAPLRAMVNGQMRSVSADFYDMWILNAMPEGTFPEAMLIGRVLNEGLRVHDSWIAKRVRVLEDLGLINEASPGDADHPYSRLMTKG